MDNAEVIDCEFILISVAPALFPANKTLAKVVADGVLQAGTAVPALVNTCPTVPLAINAVTPADD